MKKYSELILEAAIPRHSFVFRLGIMREFLIYKCGMFDAITKLLRDNSSRKNFNPDYQYPLSILYKTGRYADIENKNGVFYTNRLSAENVNIVLDFDGKWHPVNKLNTNAFDQAELIYDLFTQLGLYEEVSSLSDDDLKKWLVNFNNTSDIYNLIRTNLNFKDYTKWNRKFSADGEIAEDKVRIILESKGCEILYQGGNGDLIDMVYGTDLIVSKDDKIYTVQVKTKEDAAKKAIDSSLGTKKSYSNIDWFISPSGGGMKVFTKGNLGGKMVS